MVIHCGTHIESVKANIHIEEKTYVCILGSGCVTQDNVFLRGDPREMVSSRYSRADALKLTKTGSFELHRFKPDVLLS